MRAQIDSQLLVDLSARAEACSVIDPEYFNKYIVKRGLRDIGGIGVLVGLTEIGEVHSYIIDENEMIPVPGRLMYRGIDINDIVEGFVSDNRFGFEETGYLLLFGNLPTQQQLSDFQQMLGANREPPNGFTRDAILKGPSRDIMNGMSRSILNLYMYDDQADDTSIPNVLKQCLWLTALLPALAAYAYQAFSHYHKNNSLFIHSPRPELSTAENILHMLRPDSSYSRLEAELLDLALVLHAEHGGGNNSSFVTHVVTSSGTDTYSAIAAALGSLKGPRHGGANHKVVQMFDDMKTNVQYWDDEDEIEAYLCKLLNQEAFDRTGLIYGLGHAVYSISDPRAVILREHAGRLAQEKGFVAEFELYERVERLAPQVIAKVRKIYKGVSVNVDFYSGFIYRMLDIPPEMFTPLFAIARIVGWSAHRIEELVNAGKIIRPAYKSVAPRRAYIPMEQRS